LFKKKCSKEAFGVYRVGHIHLDYKENKERKNTLFAFGYNKDEKGQKYKF
jgi:hypothetical protein